MTRFRRGAATLLAAGALGGGGVLLGACDPCAGVVGCERESRLSLSGQLVQHEGGRPVAGVRVEIVPASGASQSFAPLAATTNAEGLWHAAGPAPAGDVAIDVVVTPPAPFSTYRVSGLHARASTRRGDGAVLGRWVVDPYVQFLGEVRHRLGNAPLDGALVVFRRTGGVPATPAVTGVLTYEGGRFIIPLTPTGVGDVIGTLTVSKAGVSSGTSFPSTRLRVQYRDEPTQVGGVFPVGMWLTYTGEIFFRGTGALLTNADVTFRRTGGIDVTPAVFTARSDASGHFLIAPAPAREGEVVADLSFTPPGATRPVVLSGIRLATYDSLETRLLRVGYGERLQYAGELHNRGTFTRAVGVAIEFRRTGGIMITPSVLRATSDANGRFPLAASTADSGEVVGDLIVDPGGPRQEIYSGVRLRTFASDEQRLARVWAVGDALFYSGELFRRGSGKRLAGLDAQFVRTSGVAITPATTTGRTDAAGRFLIAAAAAASGDVVGDVVVRGPGTFTTTIRGVRLATRRDEALPLAGVWGVGPSLLYAGEVLNAAGDVPVVGAHVSFDRTGGIAASPQRIDATTDRDGRFPLHFVSDEAGDVVGTLTIRPPAPWTGAPIVIPGVRVPSFDGDEQRLLAVWRIPPP